MKNDKNKTLKKIGLAVVTAVMLLSMTNLSHFDSEAQSTHSTGVTSAVSSASPLPQITQWENVALTHIYDKWGQFTNNKLDILEYQSNINFWNWYEKSYQSLPASHRNFTSANASIIIGMYQANDPTGNKLIDEITQSEMSIEATSSPINTSYVVNNDLGRLVSNTTVMNDGQTSYLLTCIYQKDNSSLTYALLSQNGKLTPVDPYVRVNDFTIYYGVWPFQISGTSYNIYVDFTQYNNALNFKNFLTSTLTIDAIIQDLLTIIVYSVITGSIGDLGTTALSTVAGALFGVGSSLVDDLLGTTSPLQIANNFNTLFDNEWGYLGEFRIVYTLNNWAWGLVPQFAVWGRINPGNNLFEAFDSVQPLTGSSTVQNYLSVWNDIEYGIGINNKVYAPEPFDWTQYIIPV